MLSDWWAMPPSFKATTDPSLLKTYAVEAVQAGLDVDLPWALSYGQLENIILAKGGLTEDDISRSATRVLEQKFRFNADKRNGRLVSARRSRSTRTARSAATDPTSRWRRRPRSRAWCCSRTTQRTLPITVSFTKIAVVGATVPYDTNNGSVDKGTGGIVNFATDVRTGDLGSSRVFTIPPRPSARSRACARPPAARRTERPAKVHRRSRVTTATNNDADLAPVMAAAADADFVVVVAGLTAKDEGEEYTTPATGLSLALDAKQKSPSQNIQNTLINQVAALGKPMVVVLEGGQRHRHAVAQHRAGGRDGLLPGPEVAARRSPSCSAAGRTSARKLPFTWAKTADQYDTWNGNGTTVFDYHVGYSWFDFKNLDAAVSRSDTVSATRPSSTRSCSSGAAT